LAIVNDNHFVTCLVKEEATQRMKSETAMSDYLNEKDELKKKKKNKILQNTNIMTTDAKELFLIYDNKDQTVNKLLGFCCQNKLFLNI